MKCHYEVLGVPLTATVEDIKKSYRRLALEWHPDKNLHRTEEATESFQLIQQAYEVLIDPQERAWYDRNREKILRSHDEYVDHHLDVYQYFNTSLFKGYGDDEKSFYTVYRDVFEKIHAEDKPFMEEDIKVPSFGYSYSSYEEVVYPFYAYWQGYCTYKPYTWVDKYDLMEQRKLAVGRHVLRCMERENKKLREQHRKIRNEEVRVLVRFVKKRDRRIADRRKYNEQENAEKAKRAEELRRKRIAERKKNFENFKEPSWSAMATVERSLNEIEASLDSEFGTEMSSEKGEESTDADDDLMSNLYCVACDKAFRSEKALKNHEQSKKHKENIDALKEFMQEDIFCESEGLDFSDYLHSIIDEQEESEPKVSSSKRKKKSKKKSKDPLVESTDTEPCDLVYDINLKKSNELFYGSDNICHVTAMLDEDSGDNNLEGSKQSKKQGENIAFMKKCMHEGDRSDSDKIFTINPCDNLQELSEPKQSMEEEKETKVPESTQPKMKTEEVLDEQTQKSIGIESCELVNDINQKLSELSFGSDNIYEVTADVPDDCGDYTMMEEKEAKVLKSAQPKMKKKGALDKDEQTQKSYKQNSAPTESSLCEQPLGASDGKDNRDASMSSSRYKIQGFVRDIMMEKGMEKKPKAAHHKIKKKEMFVQDEQSQKDYDQKKSPFTESIHREQPSDAANDKDNRDSSWSSFKYKTQDFVGKVMEEQKETKIPKSAQLKMKKKGPLDKDEQTQKGAACVQCEEIFPSRNKLFDHLKETGHSTVLSDKDKETLKIKKKKKKKGI